MNIQAYPKFRPDLKAYEQREGNRRAVIILKDPLSDKYYRISEYEYLFLKGLDGTISPDQNRDQLLERGHYYSPEDVSQIIGKATQQGLLLGTPVGTADYQLRLRDKVKQINRSRRLSSLYFLFIPLWNPDRFLEKSLWVAKLLCNRWTVAVLLAAFPGAIYLVISGFPKIQREYLYFFNLTNLFYLWVTIAVTKLAHELGHAYTAKSFGLRVPQMGLAFLIFFPCLYCNTTDAWQLAKRTQRMAISGAGMLVELALATIAAYIWYFSKPGILNSLAFYLMGVSLISTIFFNGNPLLKFDGYFLLTDYLRLPNMYTKAFGHLRHLFLNRVLGIQAALPVARSKKEYLIFTIYGISSFIYRIFLYLGITAAVYYRFDKTVGFLLGLLAFLLFIVRPIGRALVTSYRIRSELRPRTFGTVVFVALVGLAALVLFIPIPRNSVYPCYLDSAKKQKLTVPLKTWVSTVNVKEGQPVNKGDILYRLDTSLLKLTLLRKKTAREIVQKKLELLLLDDLRRAEAVSKEIELSQADEEVARIQDKLTEAEHGVAAPFQGCVTKFDPRMKAGYQPGEGIIVGELESTEECMIHAIIPGAQLSEIHVGQPIRVWFPIAGNRQFDGLVHELKPFAIRDLRESPFSSRFGGELATEAKADEQKDVPLEAQYDCSVLFENTNPRLPLGMTGRAAIRSVPKSVASRVVDTLVRVFNRESLL